MRRAMTELIAWSLVVLLTTVLWLQNAEVKRYRTLTVRALAAIEEAILVAERCWGP